MTNTHATCNTKVNQKTCKFQKTYHHIHFKHTKTQNARPDSHKHEPQNPR